MKHRASPRFWDCYHRLPKDARGLADRTFERLRRDSRHPALHFKKVGIYWSVRIGLNHRALGVESKNDLVWFWIGSHAEYDRLLGGK